jgi:hypothetical protein
MLYLNSRHILLWRKFGTLQLSGGRWRLQRNKCRKVSNLKKVQGIQKMGNIAFFNNYDAAIKQFTSKSRISHS